jgi:hypothetical protein
VICTSICIWSIRRRKLAASFFLASLLALLGQSLGRHSSVIEMGPNAKSGLEVTFTSEFENGVGNAEGNNLVELYENNGPDGDAGIPMQRLSLSGLFLALILMLFSSLALLLEDKSHRQRTR